MEESPFVSPGIKEYISIHKIEDNLNFSVNELLRELPDDPYSFLCTMMKNKSSSMFRLNQIRMKKIFQNDFKIFLCMEIEMSYKGNTRKCLNYVLTYNSKFFENFHTTSMETLSITFEKEYSHLLNNITIEKHSGFDKILSEKFEDLSSTDTNLRPIGRILSNAISLAVYASQSEMQNISLKIYVHNDLSDVFYIDKEKIPNLAFCIFKCGKTMNSKIKYERFMLILNNHNKLTSSELSEIISKMYLSIRKILTSGKQGENGMRLNNEGSYFPPSDTLNDVIKILEEIIKETGGPHRLSIGIDCNSNNYYNETTKKYDMEGFKQPPDSDGLIEYYLKYCNEHPAITYLEDPIADHDTLGWQKIYAKFEQKPSVTISSKSYVGESLTNLRNISLMKEITEPNDHMSEDKRLAVIEENNIISNENSTKILFRNISYRINEIVTISELFECIKFMKNDLKRGLKMIPGITLWDNAVDSDQAMVIDLALGLRSNLIVLHGINNKNEKLNKINRYLELIEELY